MAIGLIGRKVGMTRIFTSGGESIPVTVVECTPNRVTQVKTDLDEARKAAMQTAIWLTLSLFIGAFSASLAATEGGGLRDGTWGKKAYGIPASNR